MLGKMLFRFLRDNTSKETLIKSEFLAAQGRAVIFDDTKSLKVRENKKSRFFIFDL